MPGFHRLLQRQIKQHLAHLGPLEAWTPFLEAVNQAYTQADEDRTLLERSLDLSSAELLKANADIRAVFQALPDLFFWVKRDGTILSCRAGAVEDLALPLAKMVGRRIQDVGFGTVGAQFGEALAAVHADRRPATVDYHLEVHGVLRYYEARLLPLHEEECIVAVRNITDRNRIQEALRQSEARKAAILNTALDCIVTIDHEGRILDFNPAAERTFGYRRDEALGKEMAELIIPPAFRESHRRGLARYLATGEGPALNRRLELTAMRSDGAEFPVELAITRLTQDGPAVFTGYLRDISERKRVEAELIDARESALEAGRLKSEFVANTSHEIRTPMTTIIGMSEICLETELAPDQREFVEAIKHSADALLRLLNDILDFSKIEAGKLDVETIPFVPRDCIGTVLKTIAVRAQQKGLELACDVAPDVPDRLLGDPTRLRQVLLNLLGNAVKFTERGEIVLAVHVERKTASQATVRFSVRDTGIGIPQDKRALIFQAFAQADGSTTRRYGGTGLGLTICSHLAELMGGAISVESEPGKGSNFEFVVPFAIDERDPAPTPGMAMESLQGKRVLVVDDSAANRGIFVGMLNRWGACPVGVGSGTEALAVLERAHQIAAPFDLVLLDHQMPGTDGLSVAERVHGDPALETAIILLTSAGLRGDAARCRRLGIAGYLPKPIMSAELLEAIHQVFANGASGRPDEFVTRHSLRENRGRFRLLLAEDNPVNRMMIVHMLERHGHSVRAVENGWEVLACLKEQSFDLVLMDVQMPELDGFQTTDAIRKEERGTDRRVPILALTAHAMRGDRERCLQAGMDGYASKPIRSDELLAAIEQLVTRGEVPAGAVRTPSAP